MIEDIFANILCVIAVVEQDDSASVMINEFSDLCDENWRKLIQLEDRYDIEIHVIAVQGRDPVAMFPGAKLR
jgi:hypothetical protein